MKVRTVVMQFQFAMIGAVVLMSGWSSRALAQDGHSPFTHQQQVTQKNRDSEFLRIVRAATERFKDVSVADVEGYKLKFGCVSGSDSGAMGMHFVNGPLVESGVIDATRPQIVIYEPTPSGGLRLIGADYLVSGQRVGRAAHISARATWAAFSFVRGTQSLRASSLLYAARLGVEGQSQRRVRELAPRRFVR